MTYNLSLINGTGLSPMLTTVNNELMFGWFGTFGLITLFIILFMAYVYKTNDSRKALVFSSLIVALSSVMFRSFELVTDIVVLICWIIAAIFLAVSFMSND